MEPEKIIQPRPRKRGRTVAAVAVVALLFGGVEVLIVRSYMDSAKVTRVFSQSVDSTTFLANVQREFFLYQRLLLDTATERWSAHAITERRTFLNRQVDLLARTGQSAAFRQSVDAVRYKLSSVNGLVRDPSLVKGGELRVKVEIRRRLDQLGMKLKRAFDAEETVLYGTVNSAVASRERSQLFLVALAGLVFIIAAVLTGVWSRSVRSRLSSAYSALVSEMDERKSLQDKLAHQAFHDALTGLANRELFRNDLEKAFARATRSSRSVGVVYLDLDNFKAVNDTLGHEAGDDVLKAVAERLGQSIRPSDTAARLGGDEFAVIVDDITGSDEIIPVAERIVEALESIPGMKATLPVRASMGIAVADGQTNTVDDLLRNADYAMYEAKTAGKNGYQIFDPEMATKVMDAIVLEHELQEGIAGGELVLHYQPLVSLPDGEALGVEALVRWNHPTRGLLQPGAFVGLAEEKGLIVSLDRWVLNEACRQLATWKKHDAGFESIYVSVNISAAHFEDGGLVSDVAVALKRSGLEASDLHVEVTESTLMRDKDTAAKTLRRLKKLGVSISLDDFGTGYSSLSYLRNFSLDTLKIDRSFVADVAMGPEDSALVKAIIKLGLTLKLEVLAEGIEERAQVDELVRMGCKRGQGFLFSKPQPPDVIAETLAPETTPQRSLVALAVATA